MTTATSTVPPLDRPPGGVPDWLAEENRRFEERKAAVFAELRPGDDFWLVRVAGRIALEMTRIDQAQFKQELRRVNLSRRAALSWVEDQRCAAAQIEGKLSSNPARHARALEATVHGCDLMVERWKWLGVALQSRGGWTAPLLAMAYDLRGTPRDLRDGPKTIEAADARGVNDAKALVQSEIARLTHRRDVVLAPADEAERLAAVAGEGFADDKDLVRLRREEAASLRFLRWARNQFPSAKTTRARKAPTPAPTPVSPERARPHEEPAGGAVDENPPSAPAGPASPPPSRNGSKWTTERPLNRHQRRKMERRGNRG